MTNFATLIMNRTFHNRVSLLNYVAIVVVAAAALCMFWHRSAAGAVAGLALMMAVVLMVERIVHTAYVFTADGMLVISKGRFSRRVAIRITDIVSVERVRAGVLGVRYVLIRYGAGREVSVQPAGEEAFVGEITRRQELMERRGNERTKR